MSCKNRFNWCKKGSRCNDCYVDAVTVLIRQKEAWWEDRINSTLKPVKK